MAATAEVIERVGTQPFFPTNIWVVDLKPAVHEPLNARLLDALDRLIGDAPQSTPGQGWQTDQVLHELAEFRELIDIIEFSSKKILDEFKIRYESFLVTGCWANISPPGGFHIPHLHPNNFLSGAYYLQADAGADAIAFHDPRPQKEIIMPEVIEQNPLNSIVHQMQIKPGRLVIFPSWFVHSVPKNKSTRRRASISFNVMFSAFAEKVSQPRWRGLPIDAEAGRGGQA